MSATHESKDRPTREGGRNGNARGGGKGGKPHHKGADNATGRSARSDLPILIYGKGENIQTKLKEFTEQLAFVAGVEFGDAHLSHGRENSTYFGRQSTGELGVFRR